MSIDDKPHTVVHPELLDCVFPYKNASDTLPLEGLFGITRLSMNDTYIIEQRRDLPYLPPGGCFELHFLFDKELPIPYPLALAKNLVVRFDVFLQYHRTDEANDPFRLEESFVFDPLRQLFELTESQKPRRIVSKPTRVGAIREILGSSRRLRNITALRA